MLVLVKIRSTSDPDLNSITDLKAFTPTSNGVRPIGSGASFGYGTTLALSATPGSAAAETTTTPTGSISFADGANALQTVPVNNRGEGSYTGTYSVGTHSITAKYSGDNSYGASTSSPLAFTITANTPTIEAWYNQSQAIGVFPPGQPVYITLWVQNSVATTGLAQAPTGTLSIQGAPAGIPSSVVLSAGVDPSSNAPKGIATILVPPSTAPGTYNITINYAGDSNYTAASNSLSLDIGPPANALTSTTTVTTSSASTSQTAGVNVSTTVAGQSGGPTPTGTLTFYASGYELGSLQLPAGTGSSITRGVTLTNEARLQGQGKRIWISNCRQE